jgi:hypothetical protein
MPMWAAVVGSALLVACAPALDWRVVTAEGTALKAELPCRPARHAREILLDGTRLEMQLLSCQAQDATWAVAWVRDVDVRQLPSLLSAWQVAASRNVGASSGQPQPLRVGGATPQPGSGRWRNEGRRPDGSAVVQDLAVFAHGTTLFQAMVLTSRPDPAAADHFMESLRLGS